MNNNEFYGIVLLCLEHEKGRYINNHHCVYFQFEANITNPYILEKRMYDEGYFRPATLTEVLNQYTLPELKTMLDKYGQKKTGKKAELVERLLPYTSELLHTSVDNTIFYLSDKGQAFLDANKDLMLYHKYHNYSPQLNDYFGLREKYKSDYHNICIVYFESLLKEGLKRHNFTFSLAFHYLHINQQEKALYYYLLNLYETLNLVYDSWMLDKDYLLKNPISNIDNFMFVTSCIPEIVNLSDYYTTNIVDVIYTQPLKYTLLNKNEFMDMVGDILNEPYFNKDKYIAIVKERYKPFALEILNDGKVTPMQRIAKLLRGGKV